MKQFFAFLAFFLLFPAAATAEVSVTCGVASSYVGKSDGLEYDPDPPHSCSLDYTSDKSWYAGVWGTEDFDGEDDFGNELDFYVGADWSTFGFDINTEGAYFALYGTDAINASMTVSKTYGRFTPYGQVNTYLPVETDGFDAGEIYQFGVEASLYASDTWSADLDAGVMYDTGPFGNPKGTSLAIAFSGSYAFSDSLAVALDVANFSPMSADKDSNFYASVSFTKGF